MFDPGWRFRIYMVHQVYVIVNFFRDMQGHNGMVRDATSLVKRFTGDVVKTGKVVAVRWGEY